MLPGTSFRATEHSVSSSILSFRGESSPVRAWLVLCCMAMLQFFIAVDVTVVNIALPSIGATSASAATP